MKIFQLTPVESKVDDPLWKTTTHRNTLRIRAESPEQARDLAENKLRIAHIPPELAAELQIEISENAGNDNMHFRTPWSDPYLVEVQDITPAPRQITFWDILFSWGSRKPKEKSKA